MFDIAITIISLISLILSYLNYSTVCSRNEAKELLNWKVRETFYALTVLGIILALKVLFGCTLLEGLLNSPQLVKYTLTLAVDIYVFVFNTILLYTLFRAGYTPRYSEEATHLLFYTAVLWLVLEKVRISMLSTFLITLLALSIAVTLVKIGKYTKAMNVIVEPADLTRSLKLFLVFTFLSSTAGIAYMVDVQVAESLFMLSIAAAILSIVSLGTALEGICRPLFRQA
ncbi:hypothetical protein [Archaeoglobus veneficus]|uniref:Uncharacterized protein n=1 Tax=Archaeoglobus veneficus (strain DSM 11195 / SNP6) TaxID=693661 RepID=F2KSR6_ARCVS|nr:hypothetical protein [Archaeoglobus veneficus]AEA46961.1 hypothetical protein Arcve_0950 [Archaeoglobus veneficus SNP6]